MIKSFQSAWPRKTWQKANLTARVSVSSASPIAMVTVSMAEPIYWAVEPSGFRCSVDQGVEMVAPT